MNITNTTIASAAALSVTIFYIYTRRYGKPSLSGKEWEDIPGPKSGPLYWLLGNSPMFIANLTSESLDRTKFFISLAQNPEWKNMCALRIFGARILCINDPDLMKEVMVKGLTRYADNDSPYTRLKLIGDGVKYMFGGNTILNSWGHDWIWRRKSLTPWFQPRKIVPVLLSFIIQRSYELIDDLVILNGKPVDLDITFSALTFDVICRYVFGRSGPDQLDFSDFSNSYENMTEDFRGMSLGFLSPWSNIPVIRETEWAQKNFKPSVDRILNFIRKAIDQAIHDAANADGNFTSLVVEIIKEPGYDSTPGSDTRAALERELLMVIMAGFDTTSHTLSFAAMKLANHPHVQEKIREEVHDILGDNPDFLNITPELFGRMKYITGVIRETQRLHPVGLLMGATVQHDTELDGFLIPKDSHVLCNFRGAYMRADIFAEPEQFQPERWLSKTTSESDDGFEDISKIGEDTDHSKLPELAFGLGPHACLGKNLAYLEMRAIISLIVERFRIEPKPGFELQIVTDTVLHPGNGAWVMLIDRKASS